MRAGALDRRITILRNVPQKDAAGQPIAGFVTFCKRRAQVVYDRSAERFTSQQVIGRTPVTFRMRYDSETSQITTLDRVEYDGREFDIIAGPRELGRRQTIEIDATARSEEPITP